MADRVVCQLQSAGLAIPRVVYAVSLKFNGYHVTKYVNGRWIYDFGPYNDYDHAMDALAIAYKNNPSFIIKYFE